jgi:hypothetical protein
VLLTVIAASPANAQATASDSWRITIAPYFMGAGESGTAIVKGHEVTVDASFSDILENLQFGAMGVVMARKGNWGFGADALWMALGANGTMPGPAGVTASVDANQGAFAFYGLRRLSPYADFMFGARVNVLQMGLRVNGPGQFSVDGTKTWVDPLVGVQLRTPESGKRWHAQVYTEIGGFGAGSDFTWQIFPTVGVDVAKWMSIEFGYRWLDIDYTTGEGLSRFTWNVLAEGPAMGFVFKF